MATKPNNNETRPKTRAATRRQTAEMTSDETRQSTMTVSLMEDDCEEVHGARNGSPHFQDAEADNVEAANLRTPSGIPGEPRVMRWSGRSARGGKSQSMASKRRTTEPRTRRPLIKEGQPALESDDTPGQATTGTTNSLPSIGQNDPVGMQDPDPGARLQASPCGSVDMDERHDSVPHHGIETALDTVGSVVRKLKPPSKKKAGNPRVKFHFDRREANPPTDKDGEQDIAEETIRPRKGDAETVPPEARRKPRNPPDMPGRNQAEPTARKRSRTANTPVKDTGGGTQPQGAGDRVSAFRFSKAPIPALHRVIGSQRPWLRYFQLEEFINLPWQKACPMEDRLEFITNYNEEDETTLVRGNVINLSVESIASVFHLQHGSARIVKDSQYQSPNILKQGHCKIGYKVSFAKKHWQSRYDFVMPLVLLKKNPRRPVSPGVCEWVECKWGVKDTAHVLHQYLHKELRRLRSSTATDGRSLSTPIGPHIALLVLGTEGSLEAPENDVLDDSHPCVLDIHIALKHLLSAQKAIIELCAEVPHSQQDDDTRDEFCPGSTAERVARLEAELQSKVSEVNSLKSKCTSLEEKNIKLTEHLQKARSFVNDWPQ